MLFAVLCGTTKRALSRVLVLIVSMGFVAHLLAACCGWGAEQSSLSSPTSPPWSERESLLIDEENKRMGTIN